MLISNVPVAKALVGTQNPVSTTTSRFPGIAKPPLGVHARQNDPEILRAIDLSKLIDLDSPHQLAFHQALKQLSAPFVDLICSVIESAENWQKFVSCPSSVRGHHSEVGGNVRHTMEVAHTCMDMSSDLGDIVDFEVLLTAALLHDFGKIHCYKPGTVIPWLHTDENRLVGHKFFSASPALSHLQRSSGFTKAQVLGLMNCLVASNMQTGDSRGPACLEAEILMKADQLSASADLYRASHETIRGKVGFGVRHPHQRQVPYHIKATTPAPTERPSGFGKFVVRTSGAR